MASPIDLSWQLSWFLLQIMYPEMLMTDSFRDYLMGSFLSLFHNYNEISEAGCFIKSKGLINPNISGGRKS